MTVNLGEGGIEKWMDGLLVDHLNIHKLGCVILSRLVAIFLTCEVDPVTHDSRLS